MSIKTVIGVLSLSLQIYWALNEPDICVTLGILSILWYKGIKFFFVHPIS